MFPTYTSNTKQLDLGKRQDEWRLGFISFHLLEARDVFLVFLGHLCRRCAVQVNWQNADARSSNGHLVPLYGSSYTENGVGATFEIVWLPNGSVDLSVPFINENRRSTFGSSKEKTHV
jgi:hypothetical protein